MSFVWTKLVRLLYNSRAGKENRKTFYNLFNNFLLVSLYLDKHLNPLYKIVDIHIDKATTVYNYSQVYWVNKMEIEYTDVLKLETSSTLDRRYIIAALVPQRYTFLRTVV